MVYLIVTLHQLVDQKFLQFRMIEKEEAIVVAEVQEFWLLWILTLFLLVLALSLGSVEVAFKVEDFRCWFIHIDMFFVLV